MILSDVINFAKMYALFTCQDDIFDPNVSEPILHLLNWFILTEITIQSLWPLQMAFEIPVSLKLPYNIQLTSQALNMTLLYF